MFYNRFKIIWGLMFMLKVVEDYKKVLEYNEKMKNILVRKLPQISNNVIGFQGDSREEIINYSSDSGFWFVSSQDTESNNKIWNAFGVQNPFKNKNLNIAVEINFPYQLNRSVSGVLLEGANGDVYIGHRGKINQVKKKVVLNKFLKDIRDVNDFGNVNEIIVISSLGNSEIINNIKAFIDGIIELKSNR